MTYTLLELTWLFFLYSFLGWCIEVCFSAICRKQFINRGFVNSPLCPIYGFGAVFFAIFLPDLLERPFFLFLGGMLIASGLEYSVGVLMEKIFRKKLWDYSSIKWNIGGYICLRYSLLWGLLAVLTMKFSNPFLCRILSLLPHTLMLVLAWVAWGLLLLDFITTAMTVLHMQISARRLQELSNGMKRTSGILENGLTRLVQRRMEKSFPTIERSALAKKKTKSTVFAEGCSFYKLLSLFFIGAFLGDITETIFCLITTGVLMSRSSVVYGPFSIVWGLGCALLTFFLYRYRNKSDGVIFLAGTLLGGAYEYICSVFTELVFGTVFWDYSGFAFNLGGRINLLYCFFWGIAAVVWLKLFYPFLSRQIEKLPRKTGTVLLNVLLVFMIFDMGISALALSRYNERQTSENVTTETSQAPGSTSPELSALDAFLDSHFPDSRMERIYPNAKTVE